MKKFSQTSFGFIQKLKWIGTLLLLSCLELVEAQNCQPQLILQNQVVGSGQTITHTASQTINAAGGVTFYQVLANGKATFKAGNEIVLKEGFETFTNGEFDAILQTCTPTSVIPNDPYFALQWGHKNTGNVIPFGGGSAIGLPGMDAKILEAWNITRGNAAVIVAIIDSGLEIGHPDIDYTRIIRPFNFIHNDSIVTDPIGHGTLVTGIIAATVNNNQGMAGVDQNCKIMPLQVNPSDSNQVARALRYAADNGAKVASMSFGNDFESAQEVKDAIGYAISKGVTVLASSGNDNRNTVDYPSRNPEVISVGSANPCGQRKVAVSQNSPSNCDRDYRGETDLPSNPNELGWGSNYGTGLDILAPGVLLPTTDIPGTLGYSSATIYQSSPDGNYVLNLLGTSFAAPFVAGVSSLMLAVNPSLKPYQIDYILKATATNLSDGNQMVNANAAVRMAQAFNNNYVLNDWGIFVNTPETVIRGNTLTATIVVKNTGSTVLPAATLSYNFNTSPAVLAQSNNLNIPALAVNQEYTFSVSVYTSIDCATNPNIHYPLNATFKASINPTIGGEASLLNNSMTNTMVINDKLPDLAPIKPTISYTRSGTNLSHYIYNYAKGQAYQVMPSSFPIIFVVTARYWASNDAIWDSSDTYLGETTTGELFICPEQYITNNFTIPASNTKPYIIVHVDPLNRIVESDEQNNYLAVPVDTLVDIPYDTVETSRINKSKQSDFEVFPNPAIESITVNYPEQDLKKITISDVLGKVKMQRTLESKSNAIEIDVSNYASGLYIIQLEDSAGQSTTKKFIKN
jgi:subtilisin family serine protease